MTDNNRTIWEKRYKRGEGRIRYPFDSVVSFMHKRFKGLDPKTINVLDFGCGPGNHLVYLVENGFMAYGVDVSETAVDLARSALQVVEPDFNVEQVVAIEGNELPFKDNMFDAIIDRSALGQNRANEIPLIIAEIKRVLKPGGTFYGINFSDQDPDMMKGEPMGGGDYGNFGEGRFNNIGTRHFFTISEIRTLFADFQINDIRILDDRSLMGKGGNTQISVSASKWIKDEPSSGKSEV